MILKFYFKENCNVKALFCLKYLYIRPIKFFNEVKYYFNNLYWLNTE